MKSSLTLEERINIAIATILSDYRTPPQKDKIISSKEVGVRRLKNYVFTQGFCIIIGIDNVKRNRLIMRCNRHEKRTRDTRKLEKKNIKKRQIAIQATNCKYNIIVVYKKRLEI